MTRLRRIFFEALEPRTLLATDFGDAPDTGIGNYHTLLANDGPRHTIVAGLKMGVSVDGEADGLPNGRANGDDVNQARPDDEDGLINPAADLILTSGAQPRVNVRVTNTTGTAATLFGWIDYNADGVFDDATERASVAVPTGANNVIKTLVFPGVFGQFTGHTYARFRLSTDVAASHNTGPAADGEVEDYPATIVAASDGTVKDDLKISDGLGGFPPASLPNSEFFGTSVASIGDLDGDGVTDLAVGARGDDTGGSSVTSDRGAVYVLFMNANGTVRSETKIANATGGGPTLDDFDRFGTSVASLGDLDGDGIGDLAVGAPFDGNTESAEGAVYVLFMNSNGTVKDHTKISDGLAGFTPTGLDTFDRFGSAVAALGDLDGDGVPDLAVGASGDGNSEDGEGAVYVLYLLADGSVKSHVKISDGLAGFIPAGLDDFDEFGSAVASLGDLDGDGVTDLAVGAEFDKNTESAEGAVYVLFMNSNGTVKSNVKISDGLAGFTPTALDGTDLFGSAVASLGDLDGDGVADLAVGAFQDENIQSGEGALYVLFLNSNGTVKSHVKMSDGLAGFTPAGLDSNDFFGSAVASLGDLDGDGLLDLAVGAYGDENMEPQEGAVYILHLFAPRLDFGDAPDTESGTGAGNYQTQLRDNGPRHRIVGSPVPETRMGANADHEFDGLPNAVANGDDVNQAAPVML